MMKVVHSNFAKNKNAEESQEIYDILPLIFCSRALFQFLRKARTKCLLFKYLFYFVGHTVLSALSLTLAESLAGSFAI
jgi:hypothetical protein